MAGGVARSTGSGARQRRLQLLNECRVSLATLDDYLIQISRVLAHPARHLKVKEHSIRINRMGIKTAENDDRGHAILSAEISVARKEPFSVILITYPRAEMLDPEHYQKQAQASIR